MANVGFTISPAPGVTNDLIAVIYKTTAPAAEVDRLLKAAPHASPYDFNFTDLVPGTYIVKIHETPDGTTLGNLRHDFWVDASLQKLLSYEVKTFQVGLGRGTPYYDPADGDTDYINPDLDGLTYTVFKPGYGPLDWAANITGYTGGGFSFTDGQKFSQDEIYTILVSNLVQQPLSPVGTGYPEDIIDVTGDISFTSTHYNNLLEVNSSATIVTITIADITTIPDGTKFGINTHNGTQRYVTLQLPVGKYCLINGVQRNAVYVGRAAEVEFIKKGNYLRVVNGGEDFRRVGEKVFTDGNPPVNGLAFVGGWKLKTDYPRAFNWYVNTLPVGELGTGTDDITPAGDNIRKWIIGTNKFWVPDHRDMSYRVTDGTRLANSYQADAVGPGTVKTRAFTGNGVGHNGISGGGVGFLATYGDGGAITTDSASGTSNNSVRTDPWDLISAAGENRVKNVAVNAYVII
jgi:hypothetical protein